MKMSNEKIATLRALGAEVVRTPTEAAFDSPESHIGVAKRLRDAIPNSVILDQYSNPDNPLAHELTTGPEIIDAILADFSSHSSSHKSSGLVDVVVAGAGTGGTLTGVSRSLRRWNSEVIVIGVDPKGSVLAYPDALNESKDDAIYQVEGIGYDFVPKVLDRMPPTVDKWLKIGDDEAFPAALRLIKEEALLVGGSSGTALAGALKYLHSEEGKHIAQTEGKNVVVLLPDGLRNYMSKPWFLGAAQETETPLSKNIKKILERS